MNKSLLASAALALLAATPASAQILGGGGLGGGGLGGGLGGSVGGTLGTTIDRGRTTVDTTTRARGSLRTERVVRTPRRGDRSVTGVVRGDASVDNVTRLGERRIVTSGSASTEGRLSLDQRMLRTRGAVAATRRGLRRLAPTSAGVQVFVPTKIAAPAVPRVAVRAFPAYGGAYYYSPGAVFVGSSYVDVYVDRQQQDLEAGLRGTGATVERRGDDLIVMLPADVTFAFDKSDIRPRFYGVLSRFADTINAYPGTDIEVVGHTDSVGSDGYNLGLSERRGRAVADFLVTQSTDPARLVVEAMGETEPVASNATVDGRAANRRVELIVHPRAG